MSLKDQTTLRVVLYEAANVMLTRPVKGSTLKSWALAVAKRAGMRKAKVALARKLAVVLHQMMRSGAAFSLTGQPAQEGPLQKRQIAEAVIIAVEKPAFLMSVHGIVSGVEVENDLLRCAAVRVQKQVDE